MISRLTSFSLIALLLVGIPVAGAQESTALGKDSQASTLPASDGATPSNPESPDAESATEDPASADTSTPAQSDSSREPGSTDDANSEASSKASPEPNEPPESNEPPEGFREEYDKRLARFQEARKAFEKALGDQRETYLRYMNIEDRSKAAREAYHQQRLKVRELMDETYSAALDLSRMAIEREAATYLVTMLQHRFNSDIYDQETLEGAARMIDGGSNLTYMFKCAARSAVVAGEFEMAKKLLDAIDEEQLEDLDRALKFNMDTYQQLYEQEQPILQKEAEEDRLPRVKFTTTQGDVIVELYLDQAPMTVSHFISLVEDGFYDGLDFYQVVDHVLALTGDPTGTGSGNCGKYLMDEHLRDDARKAFRGSLVMAKLPMGETGKFVPNSASSQFAILFLPIISVAEQQTVFGRVIEGMDAISRLRRVDPNKKKEKTEILVPPDRIIEATVIRRPETLPEPKYFDPSARR